MNLLIHNIKLSLLSLHDNWQKQNRFETYFLIFFIKTFKINNFFIFIKMEKSIQQNQEKIELVMFLKFNSFKKYILFPIATLVTAFLILIIIKFYTKIKIILLYDVCQIPQSATHILLIENKKTLIIFEIFQNKLSKYFQYKKIKFQLYHGGIQLVSFNQKTSSLFSNQDFIKTGLSSTQYQQANCIYGYNQHDVEIPSLFLYLFEELTDPLIFFQYVILIIYILQNYVTFVIGNVIALLLIIILNYIIMRSSLMKIKQIAQRHQQVEVLRDSAYKFIDSRQLVPGDLFVPTNKLVCDALLVRGQIYVNQAGLTGQNIPIAKFSIKDKDVLKQQSRIYDGSKVVESRLKPLALVTHTGYMTIKGKILREILFKQVERPKLLQYISLFLLEICVICSIVYISLFKFMMDKKISGHLIVFRVFDMLGFILPINYQIFLNLIYTISLYRLRNNNIYCTQPSKTIQVGKLKIMCFDKTGTLTNNQMKTHSIINFNQNAHIQEILIIDYQLNINDISIKLFASCHNVRKIDNKFCGDQLDICMFNISHFEYVESTSQNIISIFKNGDLELQVLKINQFESKFQSMSVIVRDKFQNQCYVFVKGAPERLYQYSINKPQGIRQTVKDLSFKGLRLLAFGYKKITDINHQLDMDREELQLGITLLGIVTFENTLKQDTVQIIQSLREADIEAKMITGDNIYIAIETAMKSQIVSVQEKILIFEGDTQKYHDRFIGQVILKSNQTIITNNIQLSLQEYCNQTIPIAMDNAFFLLDPPIPHNVKIFARISPESKASIIRRLKSIVHQQWINKGLWNRVMGKSKANIGMIGDQTNDILAIKQSDIGVGINKAESSLTSSFSIQNLIDLQFMIIESKSSLLTAIQMFRFNIFLNIAQYFTIMLLASQYSVYTDDQYNIITYAIGYGYTFLLLLNTSSKNKSKTYPNQNLMSLEYNLAFIFHLVLFIFCNLVLLILLQNNPSYIPGIKYKDKWTFQSQSNTVIFLSTQLYYAFYLIIIYKSSPWSRNIYQQYFLFVWSILLILYGIGLILFVDKVANKYADIVMIPNKIKYEICWITIVLAFISFLIQKFISKFKDNNLI